MKLNRLINSSSTMRRWVIIHLVDKSRAHRHLSSRTRDHCNCDPNPIDCGHFSIGKFPLGEGIEPLKKISPEVQHLMNENGGQDNDEASSSSEFTGCDRRPASRKMDFREKIQFHNQNR